MANCKLTMDSVFEAVIKSILENFSVDGIIKWVEKRKLMAAAGPICGISCHFNDIVVTGRRIINELDQYVNLVISGNAAPRSLETEFIRHNILTLIAQQQVQIHNATDAIESNRLLSNYVSGRTLGRLREIGYGKTGPLRRLRRYFDDGYQFHETLEMLDEVSRLVKSVDNSLLSARHNPEIAVHAKEKVLGFFDMHNAKRRIDELEASLNLFNEAIHKHFEAHGILSTLHKLDRDNNPQ